MTQPHAVPFKTAAEGVENSEGRASLEQVWKKIALYRAIREKCLDCCAGQPSEVAACSIVSCSLHPYRFGSASRRKVKGTP
jgi:hypothetical protein